MTMNEILDKIAKLLRLSKSSNENEAALAAAKAQEMMDKYRIDAASVDVDNDGNGKTVDEPIEDFSQTMPLDEMGRRGTPWKGLLAKTLARVNNCKSYSSWRRVDDPTGQWVDYRKKHLGLVGRKSDVQVVTYMYQYLVREINRLAKERAYGSGRAYVNAFRLGAVNTVQQRLTESKRATEREMREKAQTFQAKDKVENALVKIRKEGREVERWCYQNLRLRSGRRVSYSSGGGYAAGQAAGHSIRIGGAKGALGTAAPALPRR